MNRSRLNSLVDSLAFLCAVFMTSTGFVLRYVLPPGSGRLEGGGFGRGAMERPITLLWGLTRHEWGDIHYRLAIALLVVLSVHLFLHGRWIIAMIRGAPVEGSGIRLALGVFALVALLAFAIAPLLSPTVQKTRRELREDRSNSTSAMRFRTPIRP